MRTSELAGRAGIHPETLRYYERRALAETRKADLDARIADLGCMRDSITDLIATCDLPPRDRDCALLAAMEHQPPQWSQ